MVFQNRFDGFQNRFDDFPKTFRWFFKNVPMFRLRRFAIGVKYKTTNLYQWRIENHACKGEIASKEIIRIFAPKCKSVHVSQKEN